MVTVEQLIDEIALTSGSGLNSFLNLNPSLDLDSIKQARQRFVYRVNSAIKEISTLFALRDNMVRTRQSSITINDSGFIEFGLIKNVRTGERILPAEFNHTYQKGIYYERRNFNTIQLYKKPHHVEIEVNYFKMGDLVSKWEDVINLPVVFHEAIKAHIIMVESNPTTTDIDTASMYYQAWMKSVEKLESLGYRRVDMETIIDLSNTEKGWFEWH